MNILVTGGSGFLGTHVRRFFEADDLSRRSGRDILNENDAQIVGEFDVVIHLAACMDKRPENAESVFQVNVEGTRNLLRHMRKDSVFIFTSTKDVYGRFADNFAEVPETCQTMYSGQSALEWSKLIAERFVEYYARLRDFRTCILRLSTVYAPSTEGNQSNFVSGYADAINRGETIRLPAKGLPQRDILHIDDLSTACNAFINSVIQHGLYNIGGGRTNAFTLLELVNKLEAVSGLEAVIDKNENTSSPTPFNYVTDLSRITQELDWRPTVDLEVGLSSLF